MRRSLVVLLAAAAALVVVVTTAVAVTLVVDGRPGPMARHMYGDRGDGVPGARAWGGMHGAFVRDEEDYLTEMVAHHEEAVAAARELRRSERPQMRAFGADIVRTQSAEIATMKRWLEQWYDGPGDGARYRPMMRDLTRLSGDALDRVFLEDMVWHHMTAVMMSQQLLVRGLAAHPAVADLARGIRDGQMAEIFQMRRWLADWFGQGWRAPGPGWMMRGRQGACGWA